jgi:hypothetical protein
MFKSKGIWLLLCPTTPSFRLSLTFFFIALYTHLGLAHLIVAHLSWCQYDHTIDNLSIHLFRCPCENECIATHDTLWDTIAFIILENGTHV